MQNNTISTTLCDDSQEKDSNLENLPSIVNKTYSSCKRPRRNTRSKIPEKFWNSFIRCIEYPDGIYIDNQGQPNVNIFQDEEDEVSDDEFEKLPPAKKQKILHNLKRQKEKEEQEEQINLEYDKLASKESYDTQDLEIDTDFIAHMKGDEEYIPSSESESEYDSQNDSENSEDEGDENSEESCDENESENDADPEDDNEFEEDESDEVVNSEIVEKL